MLKEMFGRLKALLNFAENNLGLSKQTANELKFLRNQFTSNRLSQGKVLENLNKLRSNEILGDINQAEFQVFSQWGDDGIINFLINYLDIHTKTFIEFGVENYNESNTRFLLINNNWRGLVLDGSKENIEYIKNDDISWKYNLKAVEAFVTTENINTLLSNNGFNGEIGLLHVDIDGNDYWVWKNIDVVSPVIAIIEYNSVFGIENPWVIPYDPAFERTKAHYSNLYAGASLLSLCNLAEEKGYKFIGSNSNGNNAYFVRNDKIKSLITKSAKQGYIYSEFAESRNKEGKLTYIRNGDRIEMLRGLPLYNTEKNVIEYLK